MLPLRRHRGLWCVCTLVVAGGAACRDAEPPPAYNQDLGSDGRLLLPTATTWVNPDVITGQAEWVQFREPELEPGPERGAASGDFTPARKSEIEGEIREVVDEYNG
ncbi:unnamed protein product, partial [marine sediment metagenome]